MTILDDVRHAARSLSRSKGFTITATLTLALALGLTAPIFGMLDQMLHPYTPIKNADEVILIQPMGGPHTVTSYERFEMIRAGTRFATGMVTVVRGTALVETPTVSSLINFAMVPPAYFDLLGIAPIMGRTFAPGGHDESGIVLGEGMWHLLFPGRTSLYGATLNVEGRTYSVIGVAPDRSGDLFLASPPDRPPHPPGRWVLVLARMKPGVTIQDAEHELGVVAHSITVEHGDPRRPARFEVSSVAPSAERAYGGLAFLFGATGFSILAITCANLANLMLVRGAARRREIALRMAMGASRITVVRQLVAEAVLVAGFGGLLGVPFSIWGIKGFRYALPTLQGRYSHFDPHLSWRTVAFVFVAALVTGLVVGIYPGLRASEVSLDEPLKESGAGVTSRARRRHTVLAVLELALALPLIMETGLAVRQVAELSNYDFGVETSHLLTGSFYLGPRDTTRSFSLAYVLGVAASVPGVRGAVMFNPPSYSTMVIPDRALPRQRLEMTRVGYASAGFEAVVGIQMLAGRGFEPGDVGQNVVIVNETAARRLWGEGTNPIGHTIGLGPSSTKLEWRRVVGVMRDAQIGFAGMGAPGSAVLSPPWGGTTRGLRLAIRTETASERVASDVARELTTRLGLRLPMRLENWREGTGMAQAARASGLAAALMSVLGGSALALAAVGIYGVLAFSVGQRRREFAVRMALGATQENIGRTVVRHAAIIVLAGTALGGFLAIGAAAIMGKSPFTTLETIDALTLAASEFVLCGVAFLACLGPARRAMKADPAEILRAV